MASQQTLPVADQTAQRRVYLKTMRSVYPNSLLIHYSVSTPGSPPTYSIQPRSARTQCPSIPDSVWKKDVLDKFHAVLEDHLTYFRRVTKITWLTIGFMSVLITASIGAVFAQKTEPSGEDIGMMVLAPLIFTFLLCLIVPYWSTKLVVFKTLMASFEVWKRQVTTILDSYGVEVVKITSAELVTSGRLEGETMGGYLWRVATTGTFLCVSPDTCHVEIFWRSVKSGRHVRRYSVIQASEKEAKLNKKSEEEEFEGVIRSTATLDRLDDDAAGADDVAASRSTLG